MVIEKIKTGVSINIPVQSKLVNVTWKERLKRKRHRSIHTIVKFKITF